MTLMCECDHETCPCSRKRRIASIYVIRGNKRLHVCSACELTTDETLSTRFIVKPAAEMQVGEPSSSFWKPAGWAEEPSLARVHDLCKALNAGEHPKIHWDEWKREVICEDQYEP